MADTEREPSLHDAISAAIATHEAPEPTPASVEEVSPAAEAAPQDSSEEAAPAQDKARDEKGRFAPKTPDSAKAKASAVPARTETGSKPSPHQGAETPVPVGAVPAVQASNATTPSKAPQSWSPAAREDYEKLPKAVQDEVTRREFEFRKLLHETTEHRNGYQMFQRVVGPYEGLIRARGAEPMAVVDSAVRAYVGLHTSPPQVQAQMVANMVKGLGIPIDALDQALVGAIGQAPQQPQQPQFDPVRFKQELKEEFEQERLGSEVASWSQGKEYIEEVRATMQALLLAAAQRGQSMTLDQAYERACRADPEISDVLERRKAKEAAEAKAQNAAKVRNAASSITPHPAAQMNGEGPKGMRDYLEAAIEVHSGR